MTGIIINNRSKEIVITKAFEKAAKIFDSEEYNSLQRAKIENPKFRVKTKKSGSTDHMRGLTFNYMKNYIINHPIDGVEDNFKVLCGLDTNWEKMDVVATATYGEIKSWFLSIYPEVISRDRINQILGKSAA